MGTPATIAIKVDDDKYFYTTVNYDGYVEYVGSILVEYYNTEEIIKKLISGGALSTLGKEIGESNDFDHRDYDVCCYYIRDRNEPVEFNAPQTVSSLWTLCNNAASYLYIFENGKWTFKYDGGWQALADHPKIQKV